MKAEAAGIVQIHAKVEEKLRAAREAREAEEAKAAAAAARAAPEADAKEVAASRVERGEADEAPEVVCERVSEREAPRLEVLQYCVSSSSLGATAAGGDASALAATQDDLTA